MNSQPSEFSNRFTKVVSLTSFALVFIGSLFVYSLIQVFVLHGGDSKFANDPITSILLWMIGFLYTASPLLLMKVCLYDYTEENLQELSPQELKIYTCLCGVISGVVVIVFGIFSMVFPFIEMILICEFLSKYLNRKKLETIWN